MFAPAEAPTPKIALRLKSHGSRSRGAEINRSFAGSRFKLLLPLLSRQLKRESLPQLLRELSLQTATLVRQEIELAETELSEEAKTAAACAGLIGAAAVLALALLARSRPSDKLEQIGLLLRRSR